MRRCDPISLLFQQQVLESISMNLPAVETDRYWQRPVNGSQVHCEFHDDRAFSGIPDHSGILAGFQRFRDVDRADDWGSPPTRKTAKHQSKNAQMHLMGASESGRFVHLVAISVTLCKCRGGIAGIPKPLTCKLSTQPIGSRWRHPNFQSTCGCLSGL